MKKWLFAAIAALFATVALTQALNFTIEVSIDAENNVRIMYVPQNDPVAPTWNSPQTAIQFTTGDTTTSVCFAQWTNDANSDTIAFTSVGTSLPAGTSLVSGCIVASPSPSTVAVYTPTIRASDGTLYTDQQFTITVIAPPGNDTTPNQFSFAGTNNAPLNSASELCGTVIISGLTAAATIGVTSPNGAAGNPQYTINGGSKLSTDTTVTNGQTVGVYRQTPNIASTPRTVTLNVGGVTAPCIITTNASPVRTGVVLTLNGETAGAAVGDDYVNPASITTWPVSRSSVADGMNVQITSQLNQTGSASNAAVAALEHFAITNDTSSPGALDGSYWFRGEIYVQYPVSGGNVNYSNINGGGADKPRVNLRVKQSTDAIFALNPKAFAARVKNTFCFGIGLPSSFLQGTSNRLTLFQLVSALTTPDNYMDLSLEGTGSGMRWNVERLVAPYGGVGSNAPGHRSGTNVQTYTKTLAASNIGSYTTHCFIIIPDNRTEGSSYFKWMWNTQGQTSMTLQAEDHIKWGYSPDSDGVAGSKETATTADDAHMEIDLNLPYGGSLNGSGGPYNGTYVGKKVMIALDGFRWGDDTASVADVHPQGLAEPFCSPAPCTP